MPAVREAWTDERLDDLNGRVGDLGRRMDEGFGRVHADLRSFRVEIDDRLGLLRRETRAEIAEVRSEIHALQRLMLQVGGGMIATTMVGFLGIVATQL